MDITLLIKKNRSFRRFDQSVRISYDKLVTYIDMARHSASGTNRQPLKFLVFNKENDCARVFPYTRWAGYLKDWDGPEEVERPAAYIVILGDTDIASNYFVDHGIAAQSILLGAAADDNGGCMIGSIDRVGLSANLNLPDRLEILLIIALGKPAEKVVVETIRDNDHKYWRDEQGVHHVPKRSLDELIFKLD